ncbi:MAG: SGNH/GDSL hydrolase family protein [Bacillota bacterium]|nr:SGNH/GDSL hydrolase family protein [Bacillota bacterium]
MKFKRLSLSFASIALAGTLFASTSFAKENNGNAYGKIDLVGLGDSITFGYNLGVDNNEPSPYAFPFLMGENAQLYVSDLGIPGWTTTDLLNAVKNDQNFRQSIKHANYVTLDIGSNDLLQAVKVSNGNPQLLLGQIPTMLPILTNNLDQIIQEISKLTDAPIVVYNIYNPFQIGTSLHVPANQLLSTIINPAIAKIVQTHTNTKLADAYSAFGENQAIYVRPLDVHPTIEGQELLAKIGETVLGFN